MMKKILIMCLALMSVMAFAGCARGYDSTTGINYRNGYNNRYNTYDDSYGTTYDTTRPNGTIYNDGYNTGAGTGYNGATDMPVR